MVLGSHRRKLLEAVAALRGKAYAAAERASAVPLAERPQLTVMFCDLVGSTALSARLDPEDLRAVIGAYHRCCDKVIGRGGGFVAKYMGDGVLAYFGYPRADEHDAERAVRAALKLVERVAGLDTVAAAPLQVRVGIATGLVVVGDLIGQGASQEQAVVGETPNLAARLQALAEPGTVVIAPSTRRLTGGLFEYVDLGAVELKGLGAPVMAARVLRERRREPLRGIARARPDAARRPRRRTGAVAAPLAAGQGRRGPGGGADRRTRHRQIASGAGDAASSRQASRTQGCAISARRTIRRARSIPSSPSSSTPRA